MQHACCGGKIWCDYRSCAIRLLSVLWCEWVITFDLMPFHPGVKWMCFCCKTDSRTWPTAVCNRSSSSTTNLDVLTWPLCLDLFVNPGIVQYSFKLAGLKTKQNIKSESKQGRNERLSRDCLPVWFMVYLRNLALLCQTEAPQGKCVCHRSHENELDSPLLMLTGLNNH